MTVESATYINTLNSSYPEGGSPANELDNHARLIKAALLATFPNVTGAMNATHTELNQLAGATVLTTATAGQFLLMKATTISGGPSAVDFVNGSGGVVFSTAYDEYLITFANIRHASSTNAKLRMSFSANAGSTYDAAAIQGVSYSQAGSTESTDDRSSIAYFPVTAEQANATTTGAPGIHGWIRFLRPVDAGDTMALHSHYIGYNAGAGAGGWASAWADSGTAIDAVRLAWDSGNFANSGTIRLFGRKV